MKKIKITDLAGKATDKTVNLNEDIFGIEPNEKVMHDAIILTRASLRQGTHKTKTRAEVSGGGIKPWRQKGTGRARQGSIRSVQWVGGGVAFGPQPRDYSKKMNRKERKLALKSALADVVKNDSLIVVSDLKLKTPKTKDFIKVLEALGVNDKKVLIVVSAIEENIALASRNLQNVLILEAREINVLDLVTANVVLAEETAIAEIEEVLK